MAIETRVLSVRCRSANSFRAIDGLMICERPSLGIHMDKCRGGGIAPAKQKMNGQSGFKGTRDVSESAGFTGTAAKGA
ncbi:hypothetical protein OA90_19475 [Labrenzia sp. OB1]|nr:hypothetical protein OA90_19475 [Labrenzia sp. OB1]